MAMFDFLGFGKGKKRDQTKAGPGNADGGNDEARKKRLAEMQGQYDSQNAASDKRKADDDAKAAAAKADARKKNAKKFWGNVLGKNDG